MADGPIAVGLKLCQHAIVEEKTRHVTLVNCFRKLSFADFPVRANRFSVCVILTDGSGDVRLTLTILSLEDFDIVWTQSWNVTIEDRVAERWLLLPVKNCVFPGIGLYQVGLTIGGKPIARTLLQIESV